MKSIFVLICCLSLATFVAAEENQNQGKKKKGGQGGQAQQGQQAGGKHGKGGGQGMGKGGQGTGNAGHKGMGGNAGHKGMGNAGQTNAGQGANASTQMHQHGGKGKANANTLPAVQSNAKAKANVNANVHVRHFQLSNTPNSKITSVTFNKSYRIAGAQNWNGAHYAVFRAYHPLWHDRLWWVGHYPRVVLISGGWYYWNAGFWYPAWGYDSAHAYYPYDGPIYAYNNLPPDQVIANVQSTLQQQTKPDGSPYYQGDVDGLLGPQTRAALADYQNDHGLPPTSAIDQPTLESMGMA